MSDYHDNSPAIRRFNPSTRIKYHHVLLSNTRVEYLSDLVLFRSSQIRLVRWLWFFTKPCLCNLTRSKAIPNSYLFGVDTLLSEIWVKVSLTPSTSSGGRYTSWSWSCKDTISSPLRSLPEPSYPVVPPICHHRILHPWSVAAWVYRQRSPPLFVLHIRLKPNEDAYMYLAATLTRWLLIARGLHLLNTDQWCIMRVTVYPWTSAGISRTQETYA